MDASNQTQTGVVRSVAYTGGAQAWRFFLSLVSTVVLARLLTPNDFGLVAMSGTIVALAGLVQDLGLSQATIQQDKLSQGHLSTLFWLNVAMGALLAVLLCLVSPLVATFYREPRVQMLTVAFAFNLFIGSLQSQHMALLQRHMRFGILAVIEISAATIGVSSALVVAWFTHSYWSLVVSGIITAAIYSIGSWAATGWRPGRPLIDHDLRHLLQFGAGVSGYNVLNFFARNADNILIGRFRGSMELGLYDRAYKLLLFPLVQVLGPLGKVMLPLLARLRDDEKAYVHAYVTCVGWILLIIQPAVVVLVVKGHVILPGLLGAKWVGAAVIFQWLGLCALHQPMTQTTGWLIMTQNRPMQYLRSGIFASVTTVASFLIGLPWGATGVAAAYALTDIVRSPILWWMAGVAGPVSTKRLFALAAPHFLSAAVAAGLIYLAPAIRGPVWIEVIIWFLISYGTYCGVMLLTPMGRMLAGQATARVLTFGRRLGLFRS